MPTTISVPRLSLGRAALAQLKVVLERELPSQADVLLREVGFAAGHAAYEGFVESVSQRYGVESPNGLDTRFLGDALAGFFRDEGWGTVTSETLAPGILAIDSPDWAEAESRGATGGADAYPSCHVTSGMLSDFFTRLGGQPAAVLEVECRCRGEARCRFLVGSPEMLQWMYEGMSNGAGYAEMVSRARNEG